MLLILRKCGISLLALGLLALLCEVGPGQAQVSQIWTETTEEDFASGIGVDTVSVDIRTSPGDIILAEPEENFAFGKSAEDGGDGNASYPPENILDGDLATFWLSKTQQPLGVNIIVDLEAERLIEQIHILGYIEIFRIRGYRMSVSLDKAKWVTVAEKPDNPTMNVLETIEATVARYVRITIITIDEVHAVAISEIQVFGAGFAAQGSYFSEAKDFGALTNFGLATWGEDLPDLDMDITLQFRTDSIQVLNDGGVLEDTLDLANEMAELVPGSEVVTDESEMILYNRGFDYDIDYQKGFIWRLETSTIDSAALIMVDYSLWNGWSEEYSDPEGSLFRVTEPRRYLQYRANLSTNTTNTPKLGAISIWYSTSISAQTALGTVVPNEVPIMKESAVTYLLQFVFGPTNLGVDEVIVSTPSPARVSGVRLNENPLTSSDYEDFSDRDKIKIGFTQPVLADSAAIVEIDFRTTLFLSINAYPAQIISKDTPDNPQFVEQGEATWVVSTTGIPTGPLVSVEAKPNPFSPNGDGLFDQTFISYFVAKVAYPQPVSLKIYNLNGDRIRTLRDQKDPAFSYEIPWDGRDDSGDLVSPGVYIYQVRVNTDSGTEVLTKTITVQY
jgi:hypothetical protein